MISQYAKTFYRWDTHFAAKAALIITLLFMALDISLGSGLTPEKPHGSDGIPKLIWNGEDLPFSLGIGRLMVPNEAWNPEIGIGKADQAPNWKPISNIKIASNSPILIVMDVLVQSPETIVIAPWYPYATVWVQSLTDSRLFTFSSRPSVRRFGDRAIELPGLKLRNWYRIWIQLEDHYVRAEGALIARENFQRRQITELVVYVFVAGGFGILILYNLLLVFMGANLQLYMTYIFYITLALPCSFILTIRHVDFWYVLTGIPIDSKWAMCMFLFSLEFGLQFCKQFIWTNDILFIRTWQTARLIIWLGFAVTMAFSNQQWFIVSEVIGVSGLMMTIAFLAWRGHSRARMFILCWSPIWLPTTLFICTISMTVNGVSDILANVTVISLLLEGILFAAFLGKSLRQLEIDKEDAEKSVARHLEYISLAGTVQESLLPVTDGLTPKNVQIATYYLPAQAVGGDWYNYHYDKGQERLFLAIGDVSGKGTSAAILSGLVSGIIQSKVTDGINAGGSIEAVIMDVLRNANQGLRQSGKPNQYFVSLAVLGLDLRSGSGWLGNAGHSPILHSDGRCLRASGPLLGQMEQWSGRLVPFSLIPSDTILLMSDGMVRQLRRDRGTLGDIRRLLGDRPLDADPEGLKDWLISRIRCDPKNLNTDDDLALLAIRWLGANESALAAIGFS